MVCRSQRKEVGFGTVADDPDILSVDPKSIELGSISIRKAYMASEKQINLIASVDKR